MNPFQEFTEEDRKYLHNLLEAQKTDFVDLVKKRRGLQMKSAVGLA